MDIEVWRMIVFLLSHGSDVRFYFDPSYEGAVANEQEDVSLLTETGAKSNATCSNERVHARKLSIT